MFSGEEYIRLRTTDSYPQVLQKVEDALFALGDVSVSKSGEIEIFDPPFSAFASDLRLEGWVDKRRKEDEYSVTISFSITPNVVAWILVILLFPIGLIFLLLPLSTKSNLEQAIHRALREVKDAF
jgi:hypothetical protein